MGLPCWTRRLCPAPMTLPSTTSAAPMGMPPSARPCRASALATSSWVRSSGVSSPLDISPECYPGAGSNLRRVSSQSIRARAGFVTLFAAVGAMYPYLPVYYQSLGLRLDVIGLLGALSALAGLIGSPLWGATADRFGSSRLVMPAAAAGAAISAGALAVVHQPAALVLAAAALYLMISGVAPILDARALETVAEDRNRYGWFRVWGSGSFIVTVLLVGWLIERTTEVRSMFIVLVAS